MTVDDYRATGALRDVIRELEVLEAVTLGMCVATAQAQAALAVAVRDGGLSPGRGQALADEIGAATELLIDSRALVKRVVSIEIQSRSGKAAT